jgi:hypothetical protein
MFCCNVRLQRDAFNAFSTPSLVGDLVLAASLNLLLSLHEYRGSPTLIA